MSKGLAAVVPAGYAKRYVGYRRKFSVNLGLPDGAHLFEFPHTWDGLAELTQFLTDVPEARSLYGDTVYVDLKDQGKGAPAYVSIHGYVW